MFTWLKKSTAVVNTTQSQTLVNYKQTKKRKKEEVLEFLIK